VNFNETINCEKYLHVERTAFSTLPVICELLTTSIQTLWPSSMLIHEQDSYAPRGEQRTARREAQSRELVQLLNKEASHSSGG
jgi:hypothetical protein